MRITTRRTDPELSPLSQPHIPDVGVIGLVPDEWDRVWMGRHQILSRLSDYFHVVWVNPAVHWRQAWRARPNSGADHTLRNPPGFVVYQPPRWLPKFYGSHIMGRLTEGARLHAARRILQRRGCNRIILYIWRPEFHRTLAMVPHALSVYHIADEYTFTDFPQGMAPGEQELLREVDQVIIHSPGLMERKGKIHPRTIQVPNGVDFLAYANRTEEPEDLRAIPHPRIGYIGYLKGHVNWKLVAGLAREHPQWSFVLVGPKGSLGEQGVWVEQLAVMSNVFLLGAKPYHALPGYAQHLDVGLLCYRITTYTNCIYPLKLHEFLATGCPVVGSPIRSLQDFAHVIRLAESQEEWSRAIEDCLKPEANTKEQRAARQAVARQHDWDVLVRRIARCMCEHLGPSYVQRLESEPSAGAGSE